MQEPTLDPIDFDASDLALIASATSLCPFCAGKLTTNQARWCPICKTSWHSFEDVKNRQLAPMFQVPRDVLRLRSEIAVLKDQRYMELAWMQKTQSVTKYLVAFGALLFLLAFLSFLVRGSTFIGADYLVVIVTVVCLSLIIYLSFVFRRTISLNLKLINKWLSLKFKSSVDGRPSGEA